MLFVVNLTPKTFFESRPSGRAPTGVLLLPGSKSKQKGLLLAEDMSGSGDLFSVCWVTCAVMLRGRALLY
jgi:hypothetical protein